MQLQQQWEKYDLLIDVACGKSLSDDAQRVEQKAKSTKKVPEKSKSAKSAKTYKKVEQGTKRYIKVQ